MALTSLFVRLATVYALRGGTLVGDRVLDSAIVPIDQRAKAEREPALVVYSDDFAVDQIEGRDLLTGERSLQITIEAVVADQAEREVEGVTEVVVTIPETDEGLELQLNLIERQILRRLQADANPWSEIWRALVLKVRKFESRRGAGQGDGVRFAARQLVLTLVPLAEPGFGAAPQGAWRLCLDQIAAEPDLAGLAELLEAEFAGEPLVDWRVAQGLLGLSREGVAGMGVSPVFPAGPNEEAPILERLEIDSEIGAVVIEPEAEA